MKHIYILEYLRVARRCMEEKAATAGAYVSWHYPDMLRLGIADGSDMPNYPTTDFTKRTYRTKKRTWTFDLDHVPRNNRGKQAQHCQQLYVITNCYCSALHYLRQASHT